MVEQREEGYEKQKTIKLKVGCLGHFIQYGRSKHSIY